LKPIEFDGFQHGSGANNFSLTTRNCGDKLIERLTKDLKEEFFGMKGFSSSNLIFGKKKVAPPSGDATLKSIKNLKAD
jgi:hypothetical protein